MRLFIAIQLDETAKLAMAQVQQRLHALGKGVFVRPALMHLTLAFLGEFTAQRLPDIRHVMDMTPVLELVLQFDHIDTFAQHTEAPWWAGLTRNLELLSMQQKLCHYLLNNGFSLDSHPYVPHVTLARRMELDEEPNRQAVFGEPFSTCVSSISLMHSERVQGVLSHTELYRVSAK